MEMVKNGNCHCQYNDASRATHCQLCTLMRRLATMVLMKMMTIDEDGGGDDGLMS